MSEEVKTDGALVKDGEVKETSGVQRRTNSPYDLSSVTIWEVLFPNRC